MPKAISTTGAHPLHGIGCGTQTSGDHLYTLNRTERDGILSKGYVIESRNQVALVASEAYSTTSDQAGGLYRVWSESRKDNRYIFSTTGPPTGGALPASYVLASSTASGWCMQHTWNGSIPLYWSYSAGNQDSFYTTSLQESNGAVSGGYERMGIVCWGWQPLPGSP